MIRLEGVRKSYGAIQALAGLDLEVPSGCIYGLLGPNGAGKTTALRILCTLLAPDAGQVWLDDVDVLAEPRLARRRLGYVAQDAALDKILKGREMLNLHGALYHLSRDVTRRRVVELAAQLEMDAWLDRPCGTYSGGMRRRLDLATGLLHRPPLLVLDEPTAGLDVESRYALWAVLRQLKGEGTTILLSSHDLEEVNAMADELAILDRGALIAAGPPSQLKAALGGERITLKLREFTSDGEASQALALLQQQAGVSQPVVNRAQGNAISFFARDARLVEVLRQQLQDHDLPIFCLSQSQPSLDDVYLQATGRTLMDAELAMATTRDTKAEQKAAMR